MIKTRKMTESEIPDIWTIDRREVIENIYYFRDDKLVDSQV